MKLVHLPLMGGLLHLVQQGWAWTGCGPAQAHPCCTKCNSEEGTGRGHSPPRLLIAVPKDNFFSIFPFLESNITFQMWPSGGKGVFISVIIGLNIEQMH